MINSKCHKDYTKQGRLDSFLKKEVFNDRKTTRQPMEQFDRKKQYFYCGADASKVKKQPDRNIFHLANDNFTEIQHLEIIRTETQ